MVQYYVNLYGNGSGYSAYYSLPIRFGAGYLAKDRDTAISKIADLTKTLGEVTIQSKPQPGDIRNGANKVPEMELEVIINCLKEKAPKVRFVKG